MLNKVTLIGNLGKDPEGKVTPNGQATCSFPLATSERWTDKSGEKQEKTTWHNIKCWGKLAEVVEKFCQKGKQVYVEGRIDNRTYEKDGVTKYFTEIVASEVKFLGSRGGEASDSYEGPTETPVEADDDSQIPF